MRRFITLLSFFILISSICNGQYYNPDSTSFQKKKIASVYNPWDHIYYGGNFAGWYRSYSSFLLLAPSVGYNITKSLSLGVNVAYMYMRYVYSNNYVYSSSIYGGGPFIRQFLTKWLFLYGEYNLYNGKTLYYSSGNPQEIYTKREWVPFPMAGGGVISRIGNKGGFTAMVLYNFNYDQNKLPLYGSPLVVRFGVFF